MENERNKQVELGNRVVGKIELPKLDLKPYVGKMVEIGYITEHEGEHGYFIKLETLPLGELDTNEGIKPLTATKILGLHKDADENLGWSDDTKLGIFLKKMGVDHYNKLLGKKVQIVTTPPNKQGREFLSFN